MRRLRNLKRFVEMVVIFLVGCAHNEPPKVPAAELLELGEAAGCKLAIDKYMEQATSCAQAQFWTNGDPACAKWAPLDFKCNVHRDPKPAKSPGES